MLVAPTGSFTMGHIPGAYGVWRGDYTAKEGNPYPFGGMAMNGDEFQKFARDFGVDNDSKVVIYDEKYDATRLWWMFFLYGKTDVRILDGGYEGWKEAGYDTEMGTGVDMGSKTGNFTAKPRTSQSDAGASLSMYSPSDVWICSRESLVASARIDA